MAKKKTDNASDGQQKGKADGGQKVTVGAGKPAKPAEKPRLQRYYEQQVRPRLQEQFRFKSTMQTPKLEKIVINVGVGEAGKNAKLLESVVAQHRSLAAQKGIRLRWRISAPPAR